VSRNLPADLVRRLNPSAGFTRKRDRDERSTRWDDLWKIAEHFGLEHRGGHPFDLDVCSKSARFAKAATFFTPQIDGLAQPWFGRAFCNPPFTNIGAWLEKAFFELNRRRCSSVTFVLPATRTEQWWWAEYVEPIREIVRPGLQLRTWFMPWRLRYGTPKDPLARQAKSPNFTSVALHYWR
jgi:hypothetical protein